MRAWHRQVFIGVAAFAVTSPVQAASPDWLLHYGLPAALLVCVVAVLLWLSERKRREQARAAESDVREREERLKLALWGSGDEFWDWDIRSNVVFRIGADQLLGEDNEQRLSTDEWRDRSVHPDDLERVQQILAKHIRGGSEHFESEHRIRNADGEWIWVLSRGKIVARDEQDAPLRIAGTARDITRSRNQDRERRIATEVLRSMGEAVAVTDLNFCFTSINPAFERMTGFTAEDVLGHDASMLDSVQHSPEFYRRIREALQRRGRWQGEMWQARKDGEEFLGWIEIFEVLDTAGERSHFVSVVNDITDKKSAEQELRYLANYDTLTGLPNRTLLAERLARAIVRARRSDFKVAVLFIDLDRFKDINDSLGHAAGDRFLKAAATRLLDTVHETDTVARLGGDEFTVIIEELLDITEAAAVARRILEVFKAPLEIEGRSDVVISPSIGISLFPDHGLVPTELLKFADTAMYAAKDRGRNTFQLYDRAMDTAARTRARMIAEMRRALDRDEFRLVYQPKMDIASGRITGVEALLRWHSAELGEVGPTAFIPLAEESALIVPIGEWALREACRTLANWHERGHQTLGMSVNISALQLVRGDLPRIVRDALAETGIPPSALQLELTESMVMSNAEQTLTLLQEFRDIGVGLAIDDFGTGYSSLVYLKRLPINVLKIDKAFVGDITHDSDDEAITAMIITIARLLQLEVVAEGVETAEQLEFLRGQRCDQIQGYWLSRPLEPEPCLGFIAHHDADREAREAAVDPATTAHLSSTT